MSTHWIVLPVVVPLATALVQLVMSSRPRGQRVLGLASVGALIVLELFLLGTLGDGTVLVHRVGAWPAPFGIVLVADRLAVVMLLLASTTGLAVLAYEAATPDPRLRRLPFQPLFQFLMMGLDGAFLTGDLFNLFVFFEVLLIASYALLTLGARTRQLKAGLQFTVLNLTSSALFLVGVGTLYGLTGTLNLADLARKVPALPAGDRALLEVAATTLLVVFATKAALLPFAFWLPDTYPAPAAPVSAMLGGIGTKVGVYALLRVFTTAFAETRAASAEILMGLAAASMLIGVLGAVAQTEVRRLLSFHIVSQIGYLAFGVALFTRAGVAAAVFYVVHYTIVKCALFLIAAITERVGNARDLKHLGGLAHASPVLGVLFLVAGLSLAGMPPFSGFFAKYLLLGAGLAAGRPVVTAVGFVAGLLTLFSMIKIWTMAFWGAPATTPPRPARRGALAATAGLVAFSIGLAAGAEPLYRLADATAAQVLDVSGYVAAVLPVGVP